MSNKKAFSSQNNYVAPEVEVIEIAMQNSLLVMSNEPTKENNLF